VAATTFNGVDANIRGGAMQGPIPVDLPHTPGIDVAGTVDALGAGVDTLAIGDRVIGFLPMAGVGAAAEYAVAPADALTAAPGTVPLADAAALPVVGLTAWQALFEHAKLTAGQRVLINGAGGAVGGYAIQLAKNAGAHVVATAGPRSSRRVRDAGADQVIDHTTADVTTVVTEPVDVVLNLAPVDPAQLGALVTLIRDGGTLVNTTVWMPAPGDEKRSVKGIDLYVRSDARQLAELVAQVDAGRLRIDVAERVPLADLPALHARAATGALPGGKVTVAVAPVIPADDPARSLTVANHDDPATTFVSLVGNTYAMLITGEQTNGRHCLIDMRVPDGGGPPPHRHDFEEMFTVLEGAIEFTFRGEKHLVRAGSTVNIPANAPHFFRNISGAPARMLCMCTPAGQDEYFLRVGDIVDSWDSPPPQLSDDERADQRRRAADLASTYRSEFV
jgi:NADPH:quinone reductase-like Zn-dependent oxidoreductase/quercetin dioxygenase-like cupin family protein